MDNGDCDDECKENKFEYVGVRNCHRNINQGDVFETKAEYLSRYSSKRIDDESFYECTSSEGTKINLKDITLKYHQFSINRTIEFKIEDV